MDSTNIQLKEANLQPKSEWKHCSLGDLCVDNGKYGINASAVNFSPDLPAYIRITDIDENGNFSPLKRKSVKKEGWEDFLLEDGDILFVRTGSTTGKSYLYKSRDGKLVYAGFLIRFRPIKSKLLPEFLAHFTSTSYYKKWVSVMSVRSGQPGINSSEYAKLPILTPPIEEQIKISRLLASWDQAIEKIQKLIEQLELRKKGLMQQLLSGKKRLPGFDGDWKEYNLGYITERITTKNEELDDTVVTISAQRGFVKQEEFFKKRVASSTLSGYYLIKRGDFAYNKSYSNGYPMGAFKRLDDFDKAVVTTLYICFSVKDNVDSDYLVNYFEGGLLVRNLTRIAQEGGRAHGLLNIGISDFFDLKLTLPPKDEQIAISGVLNSVDDEIKLHKDKLEQLNKQKKGLMQQLLTGKKRVTC
ncbi:restriction endonuclease subunit S [Gramella sp. BOM4]|nr:restriction endonuclease subunit S [Christiangramia bathymodioli]